MRELSKLLNPSTIAVVGGGTWCNQVLQQAKKLNSDIDLYPVHPSQSHICGIRAYLSVKHLPVVPDATFIGINRDATIGVVERLRKLDAGGAVCFASGFAEMQNEDQTGADAQTRLLNAAGDMPILGPNCYGFINALDGKAIWPDQHGCRRVDRGVAILTQSSNIAINLTMQKRGLPIAYVITTGNQAQLSQAEIAASLLDDPRVSAIGVHIEGFQDIPAWQALADTAHELGIPIIALKIGRSDQARTATVSHTASLAGADSGAQALLDRLNIPRVDSLPTFLETLKLAHFAGRMSSNKISSISCSGGEASLIADLAMDFDIKFPPLTKGQILDLRDVLGSKVALANPLDYHTFIWRDTEAMAKTWAAMNHPDIALTVSIVDYPREDICDATDWGCATQAAIEAHKITGKPFVMVATLPELMPETVCAELSRAGVVPMLGMVEALGAFEALSKPFRTHLEPTLPASLFSSHALLTESEGKAVLADFGLKTPNGIEVTTGSDISQISDRLTFPVAVKAVGTAHKSDGGGVVLNCYSIEAAKKAARTMPHAGPFLIEEMLPAGIELLVGVINDPPHGLLLTLAAGGIQTELLDDRVTVLLPTTREHLKQCLLKLKIAKLLLSFRGSKPVNIEAVLDAVVAIQNYAIETADTLAEVEINPLICTPDGAFVADALIRKGTP